MITHYKCDVPGVIGANWAENKLEIRLLGNILYTFHAIPEAEYHAFLKCKDAKAFISELKTKYPINTCREILG